jgi:hypothetical protein
MREVHRADQLLLALALLPGAHHRRGAVRVIGADVGDAVPAQPLEAHPDVGLDVLEEVPEVNRTVRVGQRARHDETTPHGGGA